MNILSLIFLIGFSLSTLVNTEEFGTAIEPSSEEADESTSVKVTRRFEKGYNSTSAMEGSDVDLYCSLSRGDSVERYLVIWRILDTYIDPNSESLNKTQYTYTETLGLTKIRINSVTLNQRGWYQCALWDSEKNDTFNPEYIVASFEIRLRVKGKWAWVYPVGVTVVEIIILTVFLLVVLNFNLLNPDGLEEDDSDDIQESIPGKSHTD